MDIHQPQVLMEAYYGVYASNDSTSEDLYEQVADFLISEGYAEDLEDAIDLIEELDDEEIECILEGMVNPYASRPSTYNDPWGKSPAMKAHERSEQLQKTELGSKRQRAQTRRSQQLNRLGLAAKQASIREELDVYDLVLDHLLDEGYASTEQDAIQIMTNMSEEWVDEIIDEASEIMTVTSPKGEKRKVNRQNRRHPLAQAARKLLALQKRQALNPRAMGSRSARNQAANEFETNAKKSIYRLNADPNSERDTITPFGRAGYSLADRETHLANVRRKARARKGRD